MIPRVRWLRRLALAVAIGYGAVLVTLFLAQGLLLYPHGRPRPFPEGGERIDVAVSGGTVPVWRLADPPGREVVWFHGNAEQVDRTARVAKMLRKRGVAFNAVEYPGYGESDAGRPTEAGLLEAGRNGLDALRARGVLAPTCVGHSLGSGVAAEAAATGRCGALVLLAPYTSVAEAAQWQYPFVPAKWLVRDRFDTMSRVGRIAVPTLVVHGRKDRIIPFAHGKAVAAAIAGARFVARNQGHNDILDGATMDLIAALGS